LATSKIHREYKLKKKRSEILKMAVKGVELAKSLSPDVEFSPEDATRTERGFLYEVLSAAIEAGATTVNIPDTVGYSTPSEFGKLIRDIKKNVEIRDVIISVHCHNDLGMATANTLSAIAQGARQAECTINGIGERAGNASLEEVVMAIKTRSDLFGISTGVDTTAIYKTSKMVSMYTGLTVQPNKAIVGQNAFSHSSGIHQDGFLKERSTYEIIRPEDVGFSETRIVLTKLSGRHALKKRLKDLGFSLTEEELKMTFAKFKELADKKREVFDEEIIALVEDEIRTAPVRFCLDYLHVSCGTGTIPTATVRIKEGEKITQEAACGNGPIDAIYLAIDRACGISCKLLDYSVSALTKEKSAVGEVIVKIESRGRDAVGRGMSTDIIEASAKAYLSAINRIMKPKE
jgi:2-isopropylmalate synthase